MKKLTKFLFLVFFAFVCTAQIDSTSNDSMVVYAENDSLITPKNTTALTPLQDSLLNELLSYADSFLGVPYRYAGRSRAGFDCSGFIYTIYQHIGVTLSTDARSIFLFGREVPFSEVQRGDILFFTGTSRYQSGGAISHVALVYEVMDNDVKIIHAAVNGGIRYDYMSSAYYSKHYYKARRMPIFDTEAKENGTD